VRARERVSVCVGVTSRGPACAARLVAPPCLSSPTNPLSGLCSEPLFLKLRWKCTLFGGTWKDSRLLGDRWARDGFRLGHNHLPLFFLPSGAKRGRDVLSLSGQPEEKGALFLLDGGGNLGLAKRRLFCCPFFPPFGRLWYFFSGIHPSF